MISKYAKFAVVLPPLILAVPLRAEQLNEMPDWRARTAPQELPFQISDEERALIVKAMEILAEHEPSRKESMFYTSTIDRIRAGWPLTLNDIILLNGPLMMSQRDMPEKAPQIRALLNKLRKDAATMVESK